MGALHHPEPLTDPMNPTTAIDPEQRETLRIEVGNITAQDAQFLKNVVSLFADPARESHANALRKGETTIAFTARGGLAVYRRESRA